MPGFVIHAFVPTMALLAMRRYFDPRIVLYAWPFTLLPDVDYFIGIHRATGMNVFFIGAVLLATWLVARRFDPARARAWTLVAGAYLASHLLMDTFTGGIVPLYPISTFTVCWFFYVETTTADNHTTVYWEPCSHAGVPVVSPVYPVLDADQAAMVVFLVAAWLTYVTVALSDHVRARRNARAAAQPPP